MLQSSDHLLYSYKVKGTVILCLSTVLCRCKRQGRVKLRAFLALWLDVAEWLASLNGSFASRERSCSIQLDMVAKRQIPTSYMFQIIIVDVYNRAG
jgi:hypothetical protein